MTAERDLRVMRGLAWAAVVLALLSLGLTFVWRDDESVQWTTWMLPLVIGVNAGVMATGLNRSRPRLATGTAAVTGVAALAVLGGLLTARLGH